MKMPCKCCVCGILDRTSDLGMDQAALSYQAICKPCVDKGFFFCNGCYEIHEKPVHVEDGGNYCKACGVCASIQHGLRVALESYRHFYLNNSSTAPLIAIINEAWSDLHIHVEGPKKITLIIDNTHALQINETLSMEKILAPVTNVPLTFRAALADAVHACLVDPEVARLVTGDDEAAAMRTVLTLICVWNIMYTQRAREPESFARMCERYSQNILTMSA